MIKEGMEKAQIAAVLQGYAYDINRIVVLIPQGSGAAREAQSKLKHLKDAVHNDYKHRYAIARNPQLTEREQASLARDARCVLRHPGNRGEFEPQRRVAQRAVRCRYGHTALPGRPPGPREGCRAREYGLVLSTLDVNRL